MKNLFLCTVLFIYLTSYSQVKDTTKDEKWKSIYRATETKINDLVHTKLEVRFDYHKTYLYGKAWITLHPHFYPTDSLKLDAKGMNINEVSVVKRGKKIPLKFVYDSTNLRIILDKSYKANENYTVFINYVSKPNERTGPKGLYFTNPIQTDKDIPVQIYTQGETEFNSVWFPTIDKPNQKTTEEISMTVPSKYVTLSNGLLTSQKNNTDGTRTDNWKMTLPHAPYLFFMGVGDYAVIKDKYKNKEVSYYVEKDYAGQARKIFGLTPEMIAFFSKITGVDFPWPKYAQITARDYGGAMENTTATLHGDFMQQDARQLSEENRWEDLIAHELSHHWFGDLATSESWSNYTLNESLADYCETLWREYKYGPDEGAALTDRDLGYYLSTPEDTAKSLVRFYYKDKDDVGDGVSYFKGGCVLNMLRNYVGDSAFFTSLHLYLTANKFKAAEAHNLRLAFEEVTGQDLNWFWNQWYYGSGHPKLDISYGYDTAAKTAKVFIKQTQSGRIFKLPIAIDLYENKQKKRYKVWVENLSDTFSFPVDSTPKLVNVDADRILVCEKKDNKTLENYVWQYEYAGSYLDRKEAIEFAAKNQENPAALHFLTSAMEDKSGRLREFTIAQLDLKSDTVRRYMKTSIENKVKDKVSKVRTAAIMALGEYRKTGYKPLFLKALSDSSYRVSGAALEALGKIDSVAALQQAAILSLQHPKAHLVYSIHYTSFKYSAESKFDSLATNFDKLPFVFAGSKTHILPLFADFLERVKNTGNLIKGVDMIVKFRTDMPQQYHSWSDEYINDALKKLAEKKQAAGLKEQAAYIKSKLEVKAK